MNQLEEIDLFECVFCERVISAIDTRVDNEKIYCSSCYYALPCRPVTEEESKMKCCNCDNPPDFVWGGILICNKCDPENEKDGRIDDHQC